MSFSISSGNSNNNFSTSNSTSGNTGDYKINERNNAEIESFDLDNIPTKGSIDKENIDFSRISTSAANASNGNFTKVQDKYWGDDGELTYQVRDDGTVAIMEDGKVLGFTDLDGINKNKDTHDLAQKTMQQGMEQQTKPTPNAMQGDPRFEAPKQTTTNNTPTQQTAKPQQATNTQPTTSKQTNQQTTNQQTNNKPTNSNGNAPRPQSTTLAQKSNPDPSANQQQQNPVPSAQNNESTNNLRIETQSQIEASQLVNINRQTYQQVVDVTNSYRNQTGAQQLTLDDDLSYAATVRAMEIAYNKKFSHTRPNGQKWDTLVSELGLKKYDYLGENLAYAQYELSPGEACEMWKNSPSHYDNMIYPNFNKMGVGKYELDGTTYYVQLYAN